MSSKLNVRAVYQNLQCATFHKLSKNVKTTINQARNKPSKKQIEDFNNVETRTNRARVKPSKNGGTTTKLTPDKTNRDH